jgi:hypothetical protein
LSNRINFAFVSVWVGADSFWKSVCFDFQYYHFGLSGFFSQCCMEPPLLRGNWARTVLQCPVCQFLKHVGGDLFRFIWPRNLPLHS